MGRAGRLRIFDGLLTAVAAVGFAQVILGLVALAFDPSLLATRNAAGVPRWLPHGVAVLLTCVSLITWRPRIDCGVLAGWWALAAGAFSAPALVALGWPHFPALSIAPTAVGVLFVALSPVAGELAHRSRVAACFALGSAVFVFLSLAMPAGTDAARTLDAAAYTAILTAAGASAWLGLSVRRLS